MGLARLGVLLGNAKAILLVEGKDKFDEFFVRDGGAEFAVEEVASDLGQRSVVNVIDGVMSKSVFFTRTA